MFNSSALVCLSLMKLFCLCFEECRESPMLFSVEDYIVRFIFIFIWIWLSMEPI